MDLKDIAVGIALMISLLTLGITVDVGEFSMACVVSGMLLMYALMAIVKECVDWYAYYKSCYEVC